MDAFHGLPCPAEEDAAAARLIGSRHIAEKTAGDAVRDQLKARLRMPSLPQRERAIALVQENHPIRRTGGAGHLRQTHGRVPPSPHPRFVQQAGLVIVEHAAIVQMLEAVRSGNNGRLSEQAGAAQEPDPEPFGAGDVDDVVGTVAEKCAPHGRKRRDRCQSPAQPPVARKDAEIVGQQDVAVVPEEAELFLQLEQHLRRSQPRIARIVTDQQDSQRFRPPP